MQKFSSLPHFLPIYICSLFKDKLSECFVFILLGYHVSGAVLMQMDETLLGAFYQTLELISVNIYL